MTIDLNPTTNQTPQELIAAVRHNDIERIIHLVWERKASPFWALVLLEPIDEFEPNPLATTKRTAAKQTARPPPLQSQAAPTSALHVAIRTGNYLAARVRFEGSRWTDLGCLEDGLDAQSIPPTPQPHLYPQILLSGCSAVPPTFFQMLYDPTYSPIPNPLTVLPRVPTFTHLELYVRLKLFGKAAADAVMAAGREGDGMGPPPADDFTRGAELVPVPWVNQVDNELPPSGFTYIRCPVPAPEVEVNWLRRPEACRCKPKQGCMGGPQEGCSSSKATHACNYLCPCFLPPSLHPHSDPREEDAHGKLAPRKPCWKAYDHLHLPRLQLFKTAEYGWGVRALQKIEANEFVATYAAEILPPTAPPTDYSYKTTEGGHLLEGKHYGGIARFFNHSCDEWTLKACLFDPPHGDKKKEPLIVFKARRLIQPGEELTFLYSKGAFKKEGVDCLCKKCRPAAAHAQQGQHAQQGSRGRSGGGKEEGEGRWEDLEA